MVTGKLDDDAKRDVRTEFGEAVNMTASQLEKWLDLDDDDYARMRKVVGYVHRHLAQRPKGDVTETKWRYSLMNWGHDPLK
jgi:Protein of unknown function (DUF3140)